MALGGRVALVLLCAASLLCAGAQAQEISPATPQVPLDVPVTVSPPDVVSDLPSTPPAPPAPPPIRPSVPTVQAPPTVEAAPAAPAVPLAQAPPPRAPAVPAVPLAQAPPTENTRLPRKLPKRRRPTDEEALQADRRSARSVLRQALEGLNYTNPSDGARDDEDHPPHRRLAAARDAAHDDALPEEEREAGLQALRAKLSTDFEHHCHIGMQSSLLEFAAALEVAHVGKHMRMDQEQMVRVTRQFNTRLRDELEAAVESRDASRLEEVNRVVHRCSFPRHWPAGDDGERQVEEFLAWKEEVAIVFERESRRAEVLNGLEEASRGKSIPELREAFKLGQEHCDPEDLVGVGGLLAEREAKLAKMLADLDSAVSVVRDTDRPPTEEEYYRLLWLFEEGSNDHNLRGNDIDAWDEARRWLKVALWRLGEG